MSSDHAAESVSVVKLGTHIGARIDGVRLGGDLAPETVAAIRAALNEHKVIFFRDQHHLTEDGQHEFAQLLGSPTTPHPTVTSKGVKSLAIDSHHGRANSWHSDVTFVDRIPKASILRAVTLPSYGGSTTWASTVAAYASLPEPLKRLAEELRAVHTNKYDYAASHEEQPDPNAQAYREEFQSTYYETEHPVVRVHPETGERALLLGHFVKQFVGLSSNESHALFRLLQDRVTRLEHTTRWNWSLGDVAIWDNRATQHYAIDDYDGAEHRKLTRITLAGDIPVGVDGRTSLSIAGNADHYSIIEDLAEAA
ncbi:taurine catabolism dioxygenase [Nocardia sp. 852002-20019_SCH5090214]|jgi:taurine dioxygenase|uniref:Alpha-ketoglutarate-dependent sulfate ester dioxygenase n=1 Tax=Nocardia nova TaxID=37330 RepID=A0A2S6A1J4_9NOCA|nr:MULTISPECIES: TauD/TfdA family dioxygenase [Nocardia]OBF86549.1 taurine catabolism dioxygenase [Mycobacterium sp. 852002-51759_SCH5129042]MBF6275515.1 TauD/TfdA family dioxygenase [Nocardia nova]OBA56320.1 taurine catabolism dioxygenase [Nocardia sp. 852002-51101_SCH5132738]OBA58992.1 taurine catabolism dioxygenase [Nocardia sp. 852002-20019_SCH5090214]OBB54462.1 taurine catabolism dioxygenase [Nocardia sp. 852002-51244_SCH5132740]